jgi:hypothetical protein
MEELSVSDEQQTRNAKRQRKAEYNRQYRARKKALLATSSANNDDKRQRNAEKKKKKKQVQSTTVLLKMWDYIHNGSVYDCTVIHVILQLQQYSRRLHLFHFFNYSPYTIIILLVVKNIGFCRGNDC